MAMVPFVVVYNTDTDSNNVLTVPAGKVFIVTWSSHALSNANSPVFGALSGRLIAAGNYTALQLTPRVIWAPNSNNYYVGGEVTLTGWLKDI